MKYLGTDVTTAGEALSPGSCAPGRKKLKRMRVQDDTLCSWVGGVTVVKCAFCLKPCTDSRQPLLSKKQNPMAFFSEVQQLILKSIWIQTHPEYQGNLEKEQNRRHQAPWYQSASTRTDTSGTNGEPGNEPSLIHRLIYDKEAGIYNGYPTIKKRQSLKNFGKNWTIICKRT